MKKYLASVDIAQTRLLAIQFLCSIVDDSFDPADPQLQALKSLKISEKDFDVFYNLFCTNVKKTKPIKMPIFKKLFTTINSLRETVVVVENDEIAEKP